MRIFGPRAKTVVRWNVSLTTAASSPDHPRVARVAGADRAASEFARCGVVWISGAMSADDAGWFADRVLAARDAWTPAFGGEQWSLGRAFYTHLEEGLDGDYFRFATRSDAEVEARAPGLQAAMLDASARALGAPVVRRVGFCGPGVHVFLPGGPVSERGGVVHYDTEGLTPAQLAARSPAATLVLMLRPAPEDGGTTVWDVDYRGRDHATPDELARTSTTLRYAAGDAVLLDAYRLHQIRPFSGGPRVSATAHLARRPDGAWECWF